MAKLQLLVDVYNQPVNPDDPRDNLTTAIYKGDLFEPKNQVEADRLEEIGAAADPREAKKREAAELDARREELRAQQAALDEQIAALDESGSADDGDPVNLKGKALEDALDAHGLSKDGTADEKRARLAEYLQAQE